MVINFSPRGIFFCFAVALLHIISHGGITVPPHIFALEEHRPVLDKFFVYVHMIVLVFLIYSDGVLQVKYIVP